MRRLFVVIALVVLAAFFAFSIVAAQTAATGSTVDRSAEGVGAAAMGPRTSHTLVQNMADVQANVVVQYYKDDGTVAKEVDDVIPAHGSKTYHANSYPELGANFLGSMVVSSDQQIVAVVVDAGSTSHDIYEGTSEGATEQFLPSVHWRSGQYTLTGFQNTDPNVAASVAITYFNQAGVDLFHETRSIPPNAAIHENATEIITNPGTGVGSVKATSLNGQKIAVAAIETFGDETYSYKGFAPTQGANKIYLSSIHKNPVGQFSFTLVQNMSNTTNSVKISYYKQDGTLANDFTKDIGPLGAYTFSTRAGDEVPTNLGNAGTAVVESLSNQPLVAVVVETTGIFAYSYDGATTADGASSLLFPSAHRNLAGQFSHTLIQNLSSTPTTLTLTYYNQDGTVANPFTYPLAASGSFTFHTGNPGSNPYDPFNMGVAGSLRVQASNGAKINGVMVETILPPNNVPGAYAGFKEN